MINLIKVSYFEIDDNIYNSNLQYYLNKTIYLLHYPLGNRVKFSIGIIKFFDENNIDIYHLCETRKGSSGSPMINLLNFKVVGVHKGFLKNKNFNIGSFLTVPIERFKFICLQKNNFEQQDDDHLSIKKMQNILFQMNKCVCKINIEPVSCTGFFCKIPFYKKMITVLLTNEHVLNANDVSVGNKIIFILGKNIYKLEIDKNRKICTSRELGITIVEILPNDEFNNSFMDVYPFFERHYYQLINQNIYIIQYIKGKNVNYNMGKINKIDGNEIIYSCNTELGASGSPILSLNSHKVIGIHKGRKENFGKKINIGITLKAINDYFNNSFKK